VFGPSLSRLASQVVVLVPGRKGPWFARLARMLRAERASVKVATAEEHDRIMAVVQGLMHLTSVQLLTTLRSLGIPLALLRAFSSPVYRVRMDFAARILGQNAEMYADIALGNPATRRALLPTTARRPPSNASVRGKPATAHEIDTARPRGGDPDPGPRRLFQQRVCPAAGGRRLHQRPGRHRRALIAMGNAAIDQADYPRAKACFDRAILLNPRLSQARLGAVRAVMLRDDPLSFAALSTLLSGLGGGGLSGLGTFASGLNASALYAVSGSPARVQAYLRDTNGYSWWAGQCDGVVPTNGLTALVNLLFAGVLELPAVLFDLNRDFSYNNTNDVAGRRSLFGRGGGHQPTFYALTNAFTPSPATVERDEPGHLAGLTNATNVVNLASPRTRRSPRAYAGVVRRAGRRRQPQGRAQLAHGHPRLRKDCRPGRAAGHPRPDHARIATIPGAGAVTNMLASVLGLLPAGSMNTDPTSRTDRRKQHDPPPPRRLQRSTRPRASPRSRPDLVPLPRAVRRPPTASRGS
jgi:hypothetical protein